MADNRRLSPCHSLGDSNGDKKTQVFCGLSRRHHLSRPLNTHTRVCVSLFFFGVTSSDGVTNGGWPPFSRHFSCHATTELVTAWGRDMRDGVPLLTWSDGQQGPDVSGLIAATDSAFTISDAAKALSVSPARLASQFGALRISDTVSRDALLGFCRERHGEVWRWQMSCRAMRRQRARP